MATLVSLTVLHISSNTSWVRKKAWIKGRKRGLTASENSLDPACEIKHRVTPWQCWMCRVSTRSDKKCLTGHHMQMSTGDWPQEPQDGNDPSVCQGVSRYMRLSLSEMENYSTTKRSRPPSQVINELNAPNATQWIYIEASVHRTPL